LTVGPGVAPELGDGLGEGVLDGEPFGVGGWLVAEAVQEADDGHQVAPRVVAGPAAALPAGGEALGHLEAVLEQVAAAVADVDAGRADAGRGPVHHPAHPAAAP